MTTNGQDIVDGPAQRLQWRHGWANRFRARRTRQPGIAGMCLATAEGRDRWNMRLSRSTRVVAAALTAIISGEALVFADQSAPPMTCPVPAGGSSALADIDARSRLAFIRATLRDQATRSRAWSWTWGIVGTGLIAENVTMAVLTSSGADRADSIVAASTSVLIPLFILIRPPRVLGDWKELNAQRSSEICATLARAEYLLARDAQDQEDGTGAFAHASGIGLNVAVGLVLIGLEHWKGVATVAGGGIIISELQVLTKPRGAIRGLRRYRQGDLSSPHASRAWSIVPVASPSTLGAGLALAF